MFHLSSCKISSKFSLVVLLGIVTIPAIQAQAVLEEVVVTAQRREENIQDVPISITSMTGDRLNARFSGGGDILQLANAAPGLHIESSNGRLAPVFICVVWVTLTLPPRPHSPFRWCLMKFPWKNQV